MSQTNEGEYIAEVSFDSIPIRPKQSNASHTPSSGVGERRDRHSSSARGNYVNTSGCIIPNLFLVGAVKAGSSTMAKLIATSPDVWLCPIKEPNHFCTDLYLHPEFVRLHGRYPLNKKSWIQDREQYLALFRGRKERYIAEASPTYLNSETAAHELFSFNPRAKIIITLRNPADRAFSDYHMNRVVGIAEGSFGNAIQTDLQRLRRHTWDPFRHYVTASFYYEQVKRYIDVFPREHVLVQVMDRPTGFQGVATEVENFLDVKLAPSQQLLDKGENAGVSPRFVRVNQLLWNTRFKGVVSKFLPEPMKNIAKSLYYRPKGNSAMRPAHRDLLWSIFQSDVEKLSCLIDQDLSFWNPQHIR